MFHEPRVRSTTVIASLVQHAQHDPKRPAAIGYTNGGRRVLDRMSLLGRAALLADRLALPADLASAGERFVGTFFAPSIDLAVATWAVLLAGGAYVPLEAEYPDDRLAYMIRDSGLQTVLTSGEHLDRVRRIVPETVRVLLVDESTSDDALPPLSIDSLPHTEIDENDLAYVIYTSGSTGRPKGVAVSHRAIWHQMSWLQASGYLNEQSVMLQKTPISFDAAQWEVLATAAGAQVVFAGQGIQRHPRDLLQVVAQESITAIQCVPTLWAALLEEPALSDCRSLRLLFSGGEALSTALAKRLLEALPHTELVNLYGPTECTINATSYPVPRAPSHTMPSMVPLGRAVDGLSVRVVDGDLTEVAPGQVGELLLSGPQLAEYYLNDPGKTADRFIDHRGTRFYRTGDFVMQDPAGILHFHGREDGQVKVNGHRVELDEISSRVEDHSWVKRATTVLVSNEQSGHSQLVVCAELDPAEASTMDHNAAGAHHRSKSSRVQVRAQLESAGIRRLDPDLPLLPWPRPRRFDEIRRAAFARKTYRTFEDRVVDAQDVIALLRTSVHTAAAPTSQITFADLGELLCWFGQFRSEERLLPKYAYASPGALYAVQLHLAVAGVEGLADGVYYVNPEAESLVQIASLPAAAAGPAVEFHFVGLPHVIEQVYQLNVREVLDFEVGHMTGLLDIAAAPIGRSSRIIDAEDISGWGDLLTAGQDAVLLGGVRLVDAPALGTFDGIAIYLQTHGDRVRDLPSQLRSWHDPEFSELGEDIIESRDMIAINQRSYAASSFAVALVVERPRPDAYRSLGRALQVLQHNRLRIGLMSSGYSSATGNPLAAARRLESLLDAHDLPMHACYVAICGPISAAQEAGEGMTEDAVHMQGPAEILREDLAQTLPTYMLPSRILLADRLPVTPNGKVDRAAVHRMLADDAAAPRPTVEPTTPMEHWLVAQWNSLLQVPHVSCHDEFFAIGGNSITAVRLAGRIKSEFGRALPLQAIFQYPRLDHLADRLTRLIQNEPAARASSRLIALDNEPQQNQPVFLWPGLGGSPGGLRRLAAQLPGRPCIGVQAAGLNEGETPIGSIQTMAREDIAEIRRRQPHGPYTLIGYSFGARVAFETAWQLEQQGERVDALLLVCPGNPLIAHEARTRSEARKRSVSWSDESYVRILASVFTGTVVMPGERVTGQIHDLESFVAFIRSSVGDLDSETVARIVRVVETTYAFDYTIDQLAERRLQTPVHVIKARGDDYAFIERATGMSPSLMRSYELDADHYSILREDSGRLADLIQTLGALDHAADHFQQPVLTTESL